MSDKVEIDPNHLMRMVAKQAEHEKEIEALQKVTANHVSEINRRLESIQQNSVTAQSAILSKIHDAVTIATQRLEIKHEENNKHLVKGLKDDIKRVQEDADAANQEVRFAKRIGALFVGVITIIVSWLGAK